MKMQRIAVFAAEPSADRLVAQALRILKERNPALQLYGIGGEALQELGLNSLFETRDFSTVGMKEVFVKLPSILKHLWQTMHAIREYRPDLFISVDMSISSYWIARAVGRRARVKIHYIAPSVWLSRPWRARMFARCYDAVLSFYAFELPYFKGYRAKVLHVGHPIFDDPQPRGCGKTFRQRHLYPPLEPIVGLFFGSRSAELQRLAPLLLESARDLCTLQKQAGKPEPRFIAPSIASLLPLLKPLLREADLPVQLVLEEREKNDALCACNIALAAIGTIGAELAVRHIPHALVYRLAPSSFLLAKIFYNLPHWGLVNLLFDRRIVPEFIQGAAQSRSLARAAASLLGKEGARQRKELAQLFPRRKTQGHSPAHRTADAIEAVWLSVTDAKTSDSQRHPLAKPPAQRKTHTKNCSVPQRRK